VHRHTVDDYRRAINWIAVADKDAVRAFVDEYARKHSKNVKIDGVSTWTEKVAY